MKENDLVCGQGRLQAGTGEDHVSQRFSRRAEVCWRVTGEEIGDTFCLTNPCEWGSAWARARIAAHSDRMPQREMRNETKCDVTPGACKILTLVQQNSCEHRTSRLRSRDSKRTNRSSPRATTRKVETYLNLTLAETDNDE